MGLFNLLKKTKKIPSLEAQEKSTNKIVHDDKNKFQAHILKIQQEARSIDRDLERAKKKSAKIQKMLTVTEAVWASAGGAIK